MNASPSPTQLVLCADDYAMDAAVSAGILSLARLRRISATSVMALSPRWAADAPALRELRDALDVGLHLDWTSAFAQAAGHGATLGALMTRAVLASLDARKTQQHITDAIERQLDAFEAHWQRAPDHVDGHQHVHQFAGIRQPLLTVLQRRYGAHASRPWLRVSQVAQPGIKAHVISAWGAQALQGAAHDLRWPIVGPLVGVYDFDATEGIYARHMQQWLRHLPAQALMMCHPAQAQTTAVVQDNSVTQEDPIRPARLREWAYLQSDAFAHDLHSAGVQLVRGTSLTTPHNAQVMA